MCGNHFVLVNQSASFLMSKHASSLVRTLGTKVILLSTTNESDKETFFQDPHLFLRLDSDQRLLGLPKSLCLA